MLNFGVRSTRCSSSTTTVRPADESKNGDRKIIRSSVAAVNELGTVPHSTEERWTGVGAKHTLQIHLPRKILYIISSPEICQINSMNRTSKIGTISKKLNVYIVMKMNFRYWNWHLTPSTKNDHKESFICRKWSILKRKLSNSGSWTWFTKK